MTQKVGSSQKAEFRSRVPIQLGPHSEILGVLFRRILSFWGPNGLGVLTVLEFFQLCKKVYVITHFLKHLHFREIWNIKWN